MIKKSSFLCLFAFSLFVACSEDITNQTAIVEEGIPINIASTYPVAANFSPVAPSEKHSLGIRPSLWAMTLLAASTIVLVER